VSNTMSKRHRTYRNGSAPEIKSTPRRSLQGRIS
jgi:hypothetical protein